jgi:hypothetical protein
MGQIIGQGFGIRAGRFIANQYFITSKPVLTDKHHILKFLESLPGGIKLKSLRTSPFQGFYISIFKPAFNFGFDNGNK